MRRSLLLVICGLLCWLGLTVSGLAQGSNIRLESRVDRLESELSRVRSQITRLEAQVSGRSLPPPTLPASAVEGLNELSLEEQFDNLATLAIEIRQDLRQLEERVAQLETD